jgi:iron complex transport system ATP-binding protein
VSEPLLELRNAGFYYRPERWIFRHYDLQVHAGEVWAFLGPNGRGKTTLLGCILGEKRLREGNVAATARPGYVPQAQRVAFGYSALDVVLMGRARHVPLFSSPSRHDRDVALAAMDRVGMLALRDRELWRLSGGERQLALIARALASESELLVFDEPAASLDLGNQRKVLSIVRSLARSGHGIVFTTHDPHHAKALADGAVLMLEDGRALQGPAATTLTDERLSELYGIPVRTVAFEHAGARRHTVVPVFE